MLFDALLLASQAQARLAARRSAISRPAADEPRLPVVRVSGGVIADRQLAEHRARHRRRVACRDRGRDGSAAARDLAPSGSWWHEKSGSLTRRCCAAAWVVSDWQRTTAILLVGITSMLDGGGGICEPCACTVADPARRVHRARGTVRHDSASGDGSLAEDRGHRVAVELHSCALAGDRRQPARSLCLGALRSRVRARTCRADSTVFARSDTCHRYLGVPGREVEHDRNNPVPRPTSRAQLSNAPWRCEGEASTGGLLGYRRSPHACDRAATRHEPSCSTEPDRQWRSGAQMRLLGRRMGNPLTGACKRPPPADRPAVRAADAEANYLSAWRPSPPTLDGRRGGDRQRPLFARAGAVPTRAPMR